MYMYLYTFMYIHIHIYVYILWASPSATGPCFVTAGWLTYLWLLTGWLAYVISIVLWGGGGLAYCYCLQSPG